MKELDEDMLETIQQMVEDLGSNRVLAALVTNRNTIIISDRDWLCEWSLNNIVDVDECPELDEMFAQRDEVFKRPDEIKNTPWAKLLFPDKSLYHSCDEDDPDDHDYEHDLKSFTDSEGNHMSYNKSYVETFYEICEEPEFEMYMLKDSFGVLIVYDNGKRIGAVIPRKIR